MKSRELPGRHWLLSAVAYAFCILVLACEHTLDDHVPREVASQDRAIRSLIADGHYEAAQTAAQGLIRFVEKGRNSQASAAALELLAETRWRNGDYSNDTLSAAERALILRRSLSQDSNVAKSLGILGRVLLLAGKADEAVDRFQASVSGLEASSGSADSLSLADALEGLGAGLVELNRYAEADKLLNRALEIRNNTRPVDQSTVAHTLELLTLSSLRAGRYADARPFLEQALRLRGNQNHPDIVITTALLGDLRWFEGHVPAARDAYARCVAIGESLLRANHPNTAHCMRRLGLMLLNLGDPPKALTLFERAASMAESSLGAEHPLFPGYLNDLAEAHRTLMDFRSARQLYEKALGIRERLLGPTHQDVATIVYNLALVSGDLGDFAEARRQFDRAAVIWTARLGAEHPFVALAKASLAQMLLRQGRGNEALALQRKVLTIREHSLGVDHRETADALGDLARTLLARGGLVEAATLSERAMDIWEKAGAPDSPGFAAALALRADVIAVSGKPQHARELYTRALTITQRVLGADRPAAVDLRVKLALVSKQDGNLHVALTESLAAEESARQFLLLTLRYLPEREALSYTLQRPTGLNLALTIATSLHSTDADVSSLLDSVIQSRALVYDEIAARRRSIGDELKPEAAALWSTWVSARQRLANLAVRMGQTPAEASLLEGARRDAERAERALAEEGGLFEATSRSPIGLHQVRSALPPGSALVSFVRYDPMFDVASTIVGSHKNAASYLAFVAKPGSEPPLTVPLGRASAIDGTVSEWRQLISVEITNSASPELLEQSRRAGVRLRNRAWDPIAPHLRGVDHVFIVADGALNLVNFAAMPVGTSEYLIDRGPTIHYLTAERDIVPKAANKSIESRGLLALGGVAFDLGNPLLSSREANSPVSRAGSTLCGSYQSLQFVPLGGTINEVQEIGQRWRMAKRQAGEPADVLTGSAASEGAFKTRAPGHRVLHLATHGFFLGDCAPSVAGTRAVAGLVNANSIAAPVELESPLLQSGLALAGANHRTKAKPTEEDGILTAEEVAAMNLVGVEWAVLSACGTGLGEIRTGEGVFGLRRAFQVAGTRTVIMSLWSVEDESARDWMGALYEGRLRRGLSTADAVRDASLYVLRARRAKGLSTHPFYWAAFVAAGDWR